jgi:Nucleotidyl transferase AbiEii toxin, Type IV TA system
MALEERLKTEAERSGVSLTRLRKCVTFELFLRRLIAVAPDRWVLKGALALDFRLDATTRPTMDIDLSRDDDEASAIEDIAAAQRLELDDFFTFAATRADAFDESDEFRALRFRVGAQLAERAAVSPKRLESSRISRRHSSPLGPSLTPCSPTLASDAGTREPAPGQDRPIGTNKLAGSSSTRAAKSRPNSARNIRPP